jgi:hypothetical protein
MAILKGINKSNVKSTLDKAKSQMENRQFADAGNTTLNYLHRHVDNKEFKTGLENFADALSFLGLNINSTQSIYKLLRSVTNFYNTSGPRKFVRIYDELLMRDYNPDINGYTLCFLVPPPFMSNDIYDFNRLASFQKFVCFSAIDFTPPQINVEQESLNHHAGAIPYAIGVSPSNSCSVTYIENSGLDIYYFHDVWVKYIHNIIKGTILPKNDYLDRNSPNYGVLDYVGSLYIVKFIPTFTNITFISKCIGIYPQALPNKELIGQRATNELTTLPFNYYCSYYKETLDSKHWIISEFQDLMDMI